MSAAAPPSNGINAAVFRRVRHPGYGVALAIILLYVLALASLASHARIASFSDLIGPYLWRVIWSSLAQAVLSTFLSLCLGACIALAIARLRSRLMTRALRALLMTAAVAPAIVVVLGVVSIYGRAGVAASFLSVAGGWPSIYGLPAILIAHVAMNAPYAARVFLNSLQQTPAEHHRIAALNGFSAWETFRHCDWPMIRRDIPGLASLIMLLCFTSFAVVLTLGGGPRWATLEVAIFEALRIDVDFGRAAILSFAQIAIAALLVVIAAKAAPDHIADHSLGAPIKRADAGRAGTRFFVVLTLGFYFICLAPIALTPLSAAPHLQRLLDGDVVAALTTSLMVAVPAALISVAAATALAAADRSGGSYFSVIPLLALAVPPFALIAGLYAPLRRFGGSTEIALLLVPLMNGLMALPFAHRLIAPAMRLSQARYGRLAVHLGVSGVDRLRLIEWPILRRPLIAAFLMAFAFSLGDFGVAALFSGQDFRTLPLLLHERMGAYRLDEAQAIALMLVALAFVAALATERFADAEDR